MNDPSFIEYIGDYKIHDSIIKSIESSEGTVQVSLIDENKKIIIVKFVDVKSVKSNKPEGMVLYSICEMSEQPPFRKFVFVNWDEEDDASFEIIARDCIIQ